MSMDYNDMAFSVNEAFRNEMEKHEDKALQAALKAAEVHGFTGEIARAFVEELLKDQRMAVRHKMDWVK